MIEGSNSVRFNAFVLFVLEIIDELLSNILVRSPSLIADVAYVENATDLVFIQNSTECY